MLTSLIEREIGPVSLSIMFFQFPAFGSLMGFCLARREWFSIRLAIAIHIVAVGICFSGAFTDFL
jgi:hypothetical protein